MSAGSRFHDERNLPCTGDGDTDGHRAKCGWYGVLAVALMLVFGSVDAGPLDREPGQRQNPAAENMLRVPGVVGLYEAEALATLQQAGLAVRIRRIVEDDPRYRNREGQVVRQQPGAGGVAMVGSTVLITVYKDTPRAEEGSDSPWDEEETGGWVPPQESGDDGTDAGEWVPPPPAEEEPDEEAGEWDERQDVGRP